MQGVESLGAETLFDYTREDFTEKADRDYDFVFDAVGKSTFGSCRKLLKPGGVYLSSELGLWAQNIFLPLWTKLFSSRKVKFPIPSNIGRSISFISELIEKGRFSPLVDREYSLEEVPQAFRYVETEQKVGNVPIRIPHP